MHEEKVGSGWRWLGAAAVLAAWGALVALTLGRLHPSGGLVMDWHSDAAIPVLQVNDPVFDAFRLYYYGQDRLGAWPWMLGQAARAVLGLHWTPERLAAAQAVWVLAGCLALWRLHRVAGVWLAASFGAVVLLAPLVHDFVFSIGHPYGWQLTLLFLAWGALRAFVGTLDDGAPRRRRLVTGAGAALLVCLACWTSTASGPLLGLALAGEVGLACVRTGASRRLLLALVPLGAGVVGERILRTLFRLHARHHFGHTFRTNARLDDLAHLPEDVRVAWERVTTHALGPLVLLG
ncbi:MAG: hypothetical protein L0Y64_26910, partial [Myxococcaceae bacterium]|nr:hypothetical protein [Myxococcaceae bacterium]